MGGVVAETRSSSHVFLEEFEPGVYFTRISYRQADRLEMEGEVLQLARTIFLPSAIES